MKKANTKIREKYESQKNMIENTRQNTVVQYEIFKNSKQKIQCNKFVDCFDPQIIQSFI